MTPNQTTASTFSQAEYRLANHDLHPVDIDRLENACHPDAIEAAMLKWPTPTQGSGHELSMEAL